MGLKDRVISKCIKDYQNVDDIEVRSRYGYLGATYALIINIFLMTFKIVVGFVFGMFALVADGLNNLTDCLSNFICMFGFKLSKKKGDKKHPYGHQKIEYIASILISFVIMGLAISTIYSSGKGIYDFFASKTDLFSTTYSQIELILTPIVLSLSIILKLTMINFSFYLAKKINSLSLRAMGKDSLNDVILTSTILIGFIISVFTKISFDNYLAILVSIFVFMGGLGIFFEASNELIGLAPSKEVVDNLVNLIKENKEVINVHDLEIRSYGEYSYYGTIHIEIDQNMNLVDAHSLMDKIECECKEKLHIDLVTHVDPIAVNDTQTELFKQRVKTILNSIDTNLNSHDFRIVKGDDHYNIIFDIVYDFDIKKMEKSERRIYKKLGFFEYSKMIKAKLVNSIEEKYKKENYQDNIPVQFIINIDDKDTYLLED